MQSSTSKTSSAINELRVELNVVIGTIECQISELLEAERGTIFKLTSRYTDTVKLQLGKQILGEARLVEVESGDEQALCIELQTIFIESLE